jgi:ribosomal protein S12 methylthiotransferase
MPQRYREHLADELPEVDAFIGLDSLESVADVAASVASGGRRVWAVPERAEKTYEPPLPGVVFSGGCHAYLKVAEGCNHRCSFCAIPAIRGRHRSRSMRSLLREAEDLLSRGVRELVLVAQDVTAYGSDLGNGSDLPSLLRALGGFGGKYRVRWLYGFPTGITDDLLDAMGATDAVCRYLDVPVQHSAPEVLRLMRRGFTAPAVAGLAGRIRAVLPDAALRTTCLLGFPGEAPAHVEHLVEYVARSEFDHMGAFVYSPEDGTGSVRLAGRPSRRTAERRRRRVMMTQKEVVDRRAAARVGKVEEVLLESPHPALLNAWYGRTRGMAPEVDGRVLVRGLREREGRGDFVPALVTGPSGYDLCAIRAES